MALYRGHTGIRRFGENYGTLQIISLGTHANYWSRWSMGKKNYLGFNTHFGYFY